MKHFDININTIFEKLIKNFDFEVKSEINDKPYYFVNLLSGDLAIDIENYHREIYVSLYKCDKPGKQINLFNLLNFLYGDLDAPKAEYFYNETNIDECYKHQLFNIANVIYDNHLILKNFFEQNVESNFTAFELFWENKHPEFYNH